jgi:transcriptional regulator with XRE-family HTH domain
MPHMSIQMPPLVITDAKQFGRAMKAVRHVAGFTTDQLAELTHVSRGTVYAREAGIRGVDIDAAVQVLAVCGYALALIPATDVPK